MSNLLQNFSNVFVVIVLCVCVRNSFQTDPLGEANTTENLQYTWRTTRLPSSNKGTNGKVKPPTMLEELPTTGDENISENLQYTWRTTRLPSSNNGTNGKVKPPTMLEELPTTGDKNISYDSSGPSNRGKGHGEIPSVTLY